MRVPVKITIPENIGSLLKMTQARGWEKAAWIYAFTKSDPGGGDHLSENRRVVKPEQGTPEHDEWIANLKFPCSISDFAYIGIAGMRDRETVGTYRAHYADAVKHRKARACKPGETVDMPDSKFPPTDTTSPRARPTPYDEDYAVEAQDTGVSTRVAKNAGYNKAAVEAAVAADPEVAKAAVRGLRKRTTRLARQAEQKAIDRGVPEEVVYAESEPLNKDVLEGTQIGALLDAGMEATVLRERIEAVRDKVREASEEMAAIVSDSTPTGDEATIETLREIVSHTTDIAFAAEGFIFQEQRS